jgi:hypothetical protein
MHGQAGTTSNILATSLISGIYFRKKLVLTQTQLNFNNLEAPLVGANSYDESSKNFFREVGIDTIIRCFKAAKLDKETVDNCCISLDNTNMLLLPGSSKTNKETFDHEMETVMSNLLKAIETVYGLIFIDISSGQNPLSLKLVVEADLVVVNLSQNMNKTNEYFMKYADSMPTEKLFYLFGKYDCKSKFNINNIRRKYHKYITPANSGVIPYNTGYLDSQVDGNTVDYIRKNLNCTKTDENAYFIMKAKSATEKVLKLAGVNIERT